jgi:hypothetical protein
VFEKAGLILLVGLESKRKGIHWYGNLPSIQRSAHSWALRRKETQPRLRQHSLIPNPCHIEHVTFGSSSAPVPTRLGPVLYGSCSGPFGAGFDSFMQSIVFNAEIEIYSVINSVPEPVLDRKSPPAPTKAGPDLPLRSRSRENWDRGMLYSHTTCTFETLS